MQKTASNRGDGIADEINRILGKYDKYKKPADPVMKRRKSKFVEAIEKDKAQQRNLSLKLKEKRRKKTKDLVVPRVRMDVTERSLRKIATKGSSRCSFPFVQ